MSASGGRCSRRGEAARCGSRYTLRDFITGSAFIRIHTLNCELSSVHRDGSEEEEEEEDEEESPKLKLAGDTLARVPRDIDRWHFLLGWIILCRSDCRCRSES